MNWLVGQFGWEQFAECEVVLPIGTIFPSPYDGSREADPRIVRQVCEYMEIDPRTVELKFYSEGRARFAMWGRRKRNGRALRSSEGQTTIGLEMSKLGDPTCVVATFTHELCHGHLLGGNRLSRDETDHEAVTDLATICLGWAFYRQREPIVIILARGDWSWWKISRQGYLTDPVLAYALALYAWAQANDRPTGLAICGAIFGRCSASRFVS